MAQCRGRKCGHRLLELESWRFSVTSRPWCLRKWLYVPVIFIHLPVLRPSDP